MEFGGKTIKGFTKLLKDYYRKYKIFTFAKFFQTSENESNERCWF